MSAGFIESFLVLGSHYNNDIGAKNRICSIECSCPHHIFDCHCDSAELSEMCCWKLEQLPVKFCSLCYSRCCSNHRWKPVVWFLINQCQPWFLLACDSMQLPCNPAVMPSPPLPSSSDPPLPQTLSLDHETFSLRSLRSLSVSSFCVCLSVYLRNERNGDISIACCCSKLQTHNPSKVCLHARTNPQTLIAHTHTLSLYSFCVCLSTWGTKGMET